MPSSLSLLLFFCSVLPWTMACGEDTQPQQPWKPISELQDASLPELGGPDAGRPDATVPEPDLAVPAGDEGSEEIQYPVPGSLIYAANSPGCDRPSCSKEFHFGVRVGVMSRYQQSMLVRRYDLNMQDAQRLSALVTDEFIKAMQSKEGWQCEGRDLTSSDERIRVMLRMNLSALDSDSFVHDVSKCYHHDTPPALKAFFDFAEEMSVRYTL